MRGSVYGGYRAAHHLFDLKLYRIVLDAVS